MECEYEKRKKCDSLYIERYNKLLKENEELYERVKSLEGVKEVLNNMVRERQIKIDKAIEYIEDRLYVNKETGEYCLTHTFDKCNLYELLKILDKGV